MPLTTARRDVGSTTGSHDAYFQTTSAYSRFFLDFLSDEGKAREFFAASDIGSVVARLQGSEYPRDALVSILKKQNSRYGAGREALENIARLGNPRSVCVFAGQQVGLFGGPLLTLYKALGLAKTAKYYEGHLGIPVVPIFWMAGDDHDFAEINNTTVTDRQGALATLALEQHTHGQPAGDIVLESAAIGATIDRLQESLGASDLTANLFSALCEAYAPGKTMVDAFATWMTKLMKGQGLCFFSPHDVEVKSLGRDFFARLLAEGPEIHKRLRETNERLISSGYHVQVEKVENASFVMHYEESRRPVFRSAEGYRVGEKTLTKLQVEQELKNHPERFSPDVITRALMQSNLFPVACQLAGPSELAYLAQVNPLFGLLDVPTPIYQARPLLTLVDSRATKTLKTHTIQFEELAGDVEQLINRVLSATMPAEFDDKFKRGHQAIMEQAQRLTESAEKFDSSLADVARQAQNKIDFSLKGLEQKIFAAHKKKNSEIRQRIYKLRNAVMPNGQLQERVLNVSSLIARHGFEVVSSIASAIEPQTNSHKVVFLE